MKLTEKLGISDARSEVLKEIILTRIVVDKSYISDDLLAIKDACENDNEILFATYAFCDVLNTAIHEKILQMEGEVKGEVKRPPKFRFPGPKIFLRMLLTLAVYVFAVQAIVHFSKENEWVMILMPVMIYFLANELWLGMQLDYESKRRKMAEEALLKELNKKR